MILTTKHTNCTKGDASTKRCARFPLSAHRMGGEGRGEVGSFHKFFRFGFLCFVCFVAQNSFAADFAILKPADFAHHVEKFNAMEDENFTNTIPNADSWSWLQKEIPFFECPDKDVEELYYFRWWSFRKHIVQTPGGFIITEFLTPVRHADVFNSISCAAGFHLAEGRWLHGQKYLDDYTKFWFRGNSGQPQKKFHSYSSWIESAAYDRFLVNGDKTFLANLLTDFVADYKSWEAEKQLTNGLFWQFDVRDGMEESISGSRTNKNARPTINSYMFANARAIAAIARLAGNKKIAEEFAAKAAQLKKLVQENLWNDDAKFFEVRRELGTPASGTARPAATLGTVSARTATNLKLAGSETSAPFANVREELGFIPWMFGLPDVAAGILPAVEPGFQPGGKSMDGTKRVESFKAVASSHANPGGRMPPSTSGRMPDATSAWRQLTDPQGFRAPFGLTTAERRHPQFRSHGVGTCEWDGAVWPFATSQTLYALANVLRDYGGVSLSRSGGEGRGEGAAADVTSRDYFDTFLTYVHSQHADGKPYIGEYLDEVTGDWINGKGGRSRYYNHSTFADLLITGVVGLRPRADDTVEVYPLLPDGTWDWFCLDGVKYHGHMLTILWDKDGSHYRHGQGLRVLVDGKEIARGEQLAKLTGKLP